MYIMILEKMFLGQEHSGTVYGHSLFTVADIFLLEIYIYIHILYQNIWVVYINAYVGLRFVIVSRLGFGFFSILRVFSEELKTFV